MKPKEARRRTPARSVTRENKQGAVVDGDPKDPETQRLVLAMMDSYRKRFEGGEKLALLAAVRNCAHHGLVMPDWLAQEFVRRHDAVRSLRYGSWDDVFGRVVRPGKTLHSMRKRMVEPALVYITITNMRSKRPKPPLGEALFAEVAKKLGMTSGSIVRDRYYEACRLYQGRPTSKSTRKNP